MDRVNTEGGKLSTTQSAATWGLYPMGHTNPSVMDVRRAKLVKGVYVSDPHTVQRRPKFHADPACPMIMKQGDRPTSRMNLYSSDGKFLIALEPDIGQYVEPCTFCADQPRPMSRDWVKYAACHTEGVDRTDLFINPTRKDGPGAEQAQSICKECPVVLHCREYGESIEQPRGATVVWGGELRRI